MAIRSSSVRVDPRWWPVRSDAGAAFVFERSGSVWNLIQTLDRAAARQRPTSSAMRWSISSASTPSPLLLSSRPCAGDQGRRRGFGRGVLSISAAALSRWRRHSPQAMCRRRYLRCRRGAVRADRPAPRRLVVGRRMPIPPGFSPRRCGLCVRQRASCAVRASTKLIAADPQANARCSATTLRCSSSQFCRRARCEWRGRRLQVLRVSFQLRRRYVRKQVSKLERDPSDAQAHSRQRSVALAGRRCSSVLPARRSACCSTTCRR